MSGNEIIECLKKAGAYWCYQGRLRAEAPHARLTSGKHSDGFVNVGQVLKDFPEVRERFAKELVKSFCSLIGRVDRIVGADTSSTELAKDIANIMGVLHIRMMKTEDKKQIWHPDNMPLLPGEIILQVEELVTTSFSALMVREGIRKAFPDTEINFVPFLPVIVDRSDPENRITTVERSIILSLLKLDIRNYDEAGCPYCAAGSEAISPKQGNNWSRLTNY